MYNVKSKLSKVKGCDFCKPGEKNNIHNYKLKALFSFWAFNTEKIIITSF